MWKNSVILLLLAGCSRGSDFDYRLWTEPGVSEQELEDVRARLVVRDLDYFNEQELVFNENYVISDLLEMGRVEEAHFRARRVLNIGMRGGFDEIRGRQIRGFLTTFYTEGRNYSWVFHVGVMLGPVMQVALAVGDLEMEEQVREILQDYEQEWDGENYFDPYMGEKLPYNMAATMAFLFEQLGMEQRSDSVARLLQRGFYGYGFGAEKYMVWEYAEYKSRREDPGHAVEDIKFMIYMWKQGRVIGEAEVRAALASWFYLGMDKQGRLRKRMDGRSKFEGGYAWQSCAWMLDVLQYNKELWKGCKK